MPELPEVETVRRGLEPYVTGAHIDKVTLNRKDLRFPFPEGFREALEGATIESTGRRAKYLLFRLSTGKTWLSHLGMTGAYRFEAFRFKDPSRYYEPTEDRKHGPEPTSHDAKVPACQGPSPTNARHERIAVSSHVSCPGRAGGQAHHGAYPEVVEETAAIEGAFLDARQHRGPLDSPRRPASAPPRRGAPESDRGGLTPAGPVRPATQSYVPTHDSLSMM